MKELLSKVMKRAWEIKREDKRNIFGICLKMAWEQIKKGVKAMAKEKFDGYARVRVNDEDAVEATIYTFKRWTKGNNDRIYMTDHKGRTCGYYDVKLQSKQFGGYKFYNACFDKFAALYEF